MVTGGEGLTVGSHKRVVVTCDLGVSPKCRGTYQAAYADVVRYRANNDGKDVCLFCSRKSKFSGRNNPNTKYPLNDSLLRNIDSEGKAYLLGWVASDGNVKKNVVAISINKRDVELFDSLSKIVGYRLYVARNSAKPDMRTVCFSSEEFSNDVCRHLGIVPGKKDRSVKFPHHIPNIWKAAFIRGYFEGDGCVTDPRRTPAKGFVSPRADIASYSNSMREDIRAFLGITSYNGSERVHWEGDNALDFLARIYDGSTYRLSRKFDLYCDWAGWVPGLAGRGACAAYQQFKCVKTRPDAVLPAKLRASDAGYDLTALEKIKVVGDVEFYDTGIKAQTTHGWWLMLAARGSITKTDYILANGVGVVDRTYTGNIIIALRKCSPEAHLDLPCRIAQLIPMVSVHLGEAVAVGELEPTNRGDGGFGSTGQ